MFTRHSTIALLSASLIASAASATTAAQPETAGSEGPKRVAEAIHNARTHGLDRQAREPLAGVPGSAQAQAVSEAIHLKKEHGRVNDSADQRMLREASRL